MTIQLNNFLIRLVYITVLLNVTWCFGQPLNQITFNNIRKEEGLPSNNISAVVKDQLGFLWIATNDGLCRYDGPNSIKIFRQEKEGVPQQNSLQSNNIRALLSDSQGYLWIGTRLGGLTRFHQGKNEWITFRQDSSNLNSLSNDEVLTIFEDSKQQIWVGTENGLNLYDRESSSFKRFHLNKGLKNESQGKAILTILEDEKGWMWVGTWSGGLHLLLKNKPGQYSASNIRHIRTTEDITANNVWKLFQDSDGRYWIGTHGGGMLVMNLPEDASNKTQEQNWEPNFLRYTRDQNQPHGLKSNNIIAFSQDAFQNLWVGTAEGLQYISKKHFPPVKPKKSNYPIHFKSFLPATNDITTITGDNVIDLYEDDQGMLWISTSDGVSQYNWHSSQFQDYKFDNQEMELPFRPSLIQDYEGNIWIGTAEEGLIKYRLEDQSLVRQPQNINALVLGKQVSTVSSPDKIELHVGSEMGVSIVNLKTEEVRKYPTPAWLRAKIKDLSIKTILIDNYGDIWFGTKFGLFIIDAKTKAYTLYEPEANNPNSISDFSVNKIIQDSEGAIWISTYNGLNKVNRSPDGKIIFKNFMLNNKNPEKGPIGNRIMCLKEIKDYIYIGTISGLCRYSLKTKQFEAISGPATMFWIRSIEQGIGNNIWVSTNEGIFKYNTQDKTFHIFDKKDGLKNSNYRIECSFTNPDGHFYFAYNKGFTCFNPQTLVSNTTPPPVYITGIEKMNRNGTEEINGIQLEKIELDHDDYRVSINYAALNFNRADKNQYIYRLKGFEDKWNEAKFGMPIIYTNLKPKHYTLQVRAANNDGVWNKKGCTLKIIQHPPYWETWWFRILSIAFLGAVIMTIFLWYTTKIRKHNEKLQVYNKQLSKEIATRKQVEQQLNNYNKELKRSNKDLEQFAYIASHDLKEPLRVIGNFSGLLSRRYIQKLDDEALEYIEFIQDGVRRMSNVMTSLLTYSTVGRQDITYQEIDLNLLLKNIRKDLSQLIQDKNASLEIDHLPTIIGQNEQIGMVFLNLISNAIKFNKSDYPLVQVNTKTSASNYWHFSVKDNGIGIAPEFHEKIFGIFKRLHGKKEFEGTGIGLSICQKIILRHQGRIWFESEVGKGSTFHFTINKSLETNTLIEEKEEAVESL